MVGQRSPVPWPLGTHESVVHPMAFGQHEPPEGSTSLAVLPELRTDVLDPGDGGHQHDFSAPGEGGDPLVLDAVPEPPDASVVLPDLFEGGFRVPALPGPSRP